jgi:hypothetical protein
MMRLQAVSLQHTPIALRLLTCTHCNNTGQLQIMLDEEQGAGKYSVTNMGACGSMMLKNSSSPFWCGSLSCVLVCACCYALFACTVLLTLFHHMGLIHIPCKHVVRGDPKSYPKTLTLTLTQTLTITPKATTAVQDAHCKQVGCGGNHAWYKRCAQRLP